MRDDLGGALPRTALLEAERAVAILDGHDGLQEGELTARFALARALVETRGDRKRARALAEQARDGWRALAVADNRELIEVERWFAGMSAEP